MGCADLVRSGSPVHDPAAGHGNQVGVSPLDSAFLTRPRRDSNPQPSGVEPVALPLCYVGMTFSKRPPRKKKPQDFRVYRAPTSLELDAGLDTRGAGVTAR
jgi:hypothetical protein